jgi:aminoglycoside phosphotransferase (APT) family kinase protein
MDAADALAALTEAGITAGSVESILGGWAYWTFDVAGEWIARFARNDDIAAATVRELSLLPELCEWVPFQVPVPTHRGTWNELPFFVYRRIAGRPITARG